MMHQARHILLAIVSLIAFDIPANAQASAIHCQKPVVKAHSFSMACGFRHQSGSLALMMSGDIHHSTPRVIQVRPKKIDVSKNGRLLQTLVFTDEDDAEVWMDGLKETAFINIDLDFDGFDDLQVWSATSAGPNYGYTYWLFNPATGLFERKKDLDRVLSGMSVSTDPEKKIINVSGRDTCCSSTVGHYHWLGDKLILIDEETSGSGGAAGTGKYLEDVPGIKEFIASNGSYCGTTTYIYDNHGLIESIKEETQGDPCDDKLDYRMSKPASQTPDGTVIHGNITDEYKEGLLLSRTIKYDPPRKKEDIH